MVEGSETEETTPKQFPTMTTVLAATRYLLGQEADQVISGDDPELRRVIEREKIEGCQITMWFGPHTILNPLRT